jgi:prepilin-type N-terminal cleavage/methylation domain-containing protein
MTNHKGFTLLELLVVIAILAVLAAVTIVVINPTELARRSRDAQRLNDLAAVTSAISFYMTETTTPSLDGGTNSTCANNRYWVSVETGFGTPAGGTVVTTTAANAGKVDGTGWIKVNLASLSAGSPIPAFPIDPVNSGDGSGSAVELFYTYLCRASPLGFQLVANMESTTYKAKEDKDGGADNNLYETGTIANYGVSLSGGGGVYPTAN